MPKAEDFSSDFAELEKLLEMPLSTALEPTTRSCFLVKRSAALQGGAAFRLQKPQAVGAKLHGKNSRQLSTKISQMGVKSQRSGSVGALGISFGMGLGSGVISGGTLHRALRLSGDCNHFSIVLKTEGPAYRPPRDRGSGFIAGAHNLPIELRIQRWAQKNNVTLTQEAKNDLIKALRADSSIGHWISSAASMLRKPILKNHTGDIIGFIAEAIGYFGGAIAKAIGASAIRQFIVRVVLSNDARRYAKHANVPLFFVAEPNGAKVHEQRNEGSLEKTRLHQHQAVTIEEDGHPQLCVVHCEYSADCTEVTDRGWTQRNMIRRDS